jgi:2-amino-4-hydroxy-6-hydroxymethyldihydropteridine diphosphokinase
MPAMAKSTCCIGLGGNTGPVAATFADALRAMHAHGVKVGEQSRLYQTRPMGPAAAPFLNACVTAETVLPPEQLLAALKDIEAAAGREPGARWSARALDLDVLLIDDQVIRTPTLSVPHPGVVYRRFVLDPLHDVAAGVLVPPTMRTVSELRMRLLRRPLPIAVVGGSAEGRGLIEGVVRERFPAVRLVSEREGPQSRGDVTVFLLDEAADMPDVRGRGVMVPVERGLGSPESALCAMLEAMLDEPECVGELSRP